MKKIIYILAAFAAVSCSEGVGDSSYAPVAPFTLSVDRSEIESDGKQVATFVITDADGKILTDNSDLLSKIYFKNEATGKRLPRRTNTFKSVEDGEYLFSATVSGEPCSNKVSITSSGRSKYEVFRKMVAVYRFTASWCQYCPSMTQGFDRVSDWTKSRYVELAMHAGGSEFALNDMAAQYGTYYYNHYGLPSCLYDLDVRSDDRAYDEIENIIFNRCFFNYNRHFKICTVKLDFHFVLAFVAGNTKNSISLEEHIINFCFVFLGKHYDQYSHQYR